MSVAADKVHRPYVLVCVMLAVFLASIEVTIVATAMPQIVAELGGFDLYGWVFAAVLLAQAATTVIFGKLADIYGRKPILIIGVAFFLVGSLLCGFAWSMPALILFRIVQGIGMGSLQPVSMTVFGDLYTPEERVRMQGYLAAVWGASAVVGPLAGGLIVQHMTWPFVFWLPIPVGIATIIGLQLYLHENVEEKKPAIDYAGAGLVTIAVVSLLMVLTLVGQPTPDAGALALSGAVFVLSLPLLWWQERRAPDPVIAFDLWTHRAIASGNTATLFAGMVFMGATTFLPVYVQAVMWRSPLVAGVAVTMIAVGWPIAAVVCPRLYKRQGMRFTARLGGFLIVAGTVPFLFLGPGTSPVFVAAASTLIGFGLGFLMSTVTVLVQGSVKWAQRGSATASIVFARTLGNALGAAVLGSIVNVTLATQSVSPEEIRGLLGHAAAAAPPPLHLRAALDHGLHLAFWGVFAVAVATLIAAFAVPTRELHELSGGIGKHRLQPQPKESE